MMFLIDACSDTGKVRSHNEDMILVGDQLVRDGAYASSIDIGKDKLFIAVADGMGGHNGGELASEFVARRMAMMLATPFNSTAFSELAQEMDVRVKEISAALNRLGAEQTQFSGLGTTFAGLLIFENNIFLLNVGDSRVYRLRGSFLTQMTRDHSLRNLLNDPTIASNQITNCFGGGVNDMFLDFSDITQQVLPADRFVVCSDGLSGEIPDEDLELWLSAGKTAKELVERSLLSGGRDNISCILIDVHESDSI